VRILLRLRKEFTNPPITPTVQDDGARMGNVEEVLESDSVSDTSESMETVKDLKMKERCANVHENKGPAFSGPEQSGNVVENEGRYALKAGMLCAPQRRGSPVGGSPTQIVVGKSGS
jgi:hypothetical protein